MQFRRKGISVGSFGEFRDEFRASHTILQYLRWHTTLGTTIFFEICRKLFWCHENRYAIIREPHGSFVTKLVTALPVHPKLSCLSQGFPLISLILRPVNK